MKKNKIHYNEVNSIIVESVYDFKNYVLFCSTVQKNSISKFDNFELKVYVV